MPLRALLPVLLLILISGVPGAARPQRPSDAVPIPAPDPVLMALTLAADTDEKREALLRDRPDLASGEVRLAINAALASRGTSGDAIPVIHAYRALLLAATRAGDTRGRVRSLVNIGTLAGQIGDFEAAEPVLVEARDLALSADFEDAPLFITAANNLGIVQRLQGKYDEAIASFERTLAVAEQSGRRDTVARAYNNLGVVAQMRGDLRAALDYFTRSLVLKEELKQAQDIASTLNNIGNIHQLQRNFGLALEHYQQVQRYAIDLGNRRALASALNSLGEVYAIQGRYDLARDALSKALPVAEGIEDNVRVATIHHTLGVVARAERRWTDAAEAFGRGLAMRETMRDKPGIADSLAGLAEVALARGQADLALGYAGRSVEAARAIGQAPILWGSLTLLGRANAALARPEPAVRALEEAIEVIERLRQQVAGGAQDFQRFFEDKSEPYYELAALHAASARPADAFALVERARARVLLDLIAGGQPIVQTLTAEERAREIELERAVVALTSQRAAAQQQARAERVARLDEALTRARLARDNWQFQMYLRYPDLRFGRGEAPVLPFADALAMVPADTSVVMFLAGAERTRVLLVTKPAAGAPTLQFQTINVSRDALASRSQALTRQLASRDLAFMPAARSLYDLLLGQVDQRLTRTRRLIVVPDATLWDVPFQALISPRGRFVIEERAVSYAPSVSALARLAERQAGRTPGPHRLLAIGDPSAAAQGQQPRLPEAAREVRALAGMYGAGSQLFVGDAATETQFRAAAPSATVIHIATHGELDRTSPMYSHVALGSGDQPDAPVGDGRVEAWEIANVPLRANLAVLSACETARGTDRGGEGVIGLTWSLFAAGTSTAAVSLWRVDSASTTELMLAFHRSLRSGQQPASAMQAASRTLLASPQYRHPFYWAGFVVVGAP